MDEVKGKSYNESIKMRRERFFCKDEGQKLESMGEDSRAVFCEGESLEKMGAAVGRR